MADAGDLRDRLFETLYYYHAFPPGMNLATGVLLEMGDARAAGLAHAFFWALGLVLVNVMCYVARAAGLSTRVAAMLTLAFALTPASIYFAHLYHYEWPVATLLCLAAALFFCGVRRPSFGAWLACFSTCAIVALTRSTFHPVWYIAVAALAASFVERPVRRRVFVAAAAPALVLFGVCLKNALLFGDFAVSTFGPSSLTLATIAHLPDDVRDEWIGAGKLSPYAAVSVYAPPRDYARFFQTAEHERWPSQLTRLEHASADAPNYNHWWLLDSQRARRSDVFYYIASRPLDYLANVVGNVRDMAGPTTAWHPRDGTPASPHYRHRTLLGGYETWFNRVVHDFPVPPLGLYLFVPIPLVWACARAWSRSRNFDPDERARTALIVFLLFQIVYVVAASAMLTSLESSRYRYQIEWMIWVVTALFVARLWQPIRRWRLLGAYNPLS